MADNLLAEAERAVLEAALAWGQWRLSEGEMVECAHCGALVPMAEQERALLERLDALSRALVNAAAVADTERPGERARG